MFTSFSWRDRLSSLLMRGCEIDAITHTTDDNNAESAIQLFQFSAEKDPTFLLKETMAMSGSRMAPLSIAMLYACAPDEFLKNKDNRFNMHSILSDKIPSQLLECAEMLRSKTFGRGLGNRPQKALRRIMESWNSEDLEEFAIGQPRALYALVRLIHPRYNDFRGELIKSLLKGDFKR